jgi:hypothetical protein
MTRYITILGFVDHIESESKTTEFCYYSSKVDMNNIKINEYGFILIKLYLQRQMQDNSSPEVILS